MGAKGAAERVVYWAAYEVEGFMKCGTAEGPPCTIAPGCSGNGGQRCTFGEFVRYTWAPFEAETEHDRRDCRDLPSSSEKEPRTAIQHYNDILRWYDLTAEKPSDRIKPNLLTKNVDHARTLPGSSNWYELLQRSTGPIKLVKEEIFKWEETARVKFRKAAEEEWVASIKLITPGISDEEVQKNLKDNEVNIDEDTQKGLDKEKKHLFGKQLPIIQKAEDAIKGVLYLRGVDFEAYRLGKDGTLLMDLEKIMNNEEQFKRVKLETRTPDAKSTAGFGNSGRYVDLDKTIEKYISRGGTFSEDEMRKMFLDAHNQRLLPRPDPKTGEIKASQYSTHLETFLSAEKAAQVLNCADIKIDIMRKRSLEGHERR
ncbi:hypothetical protein H072_10909 [Dactylellina haptotyla CBS 200.50]|uniref:Uncharacterized protein n=1 Tax=Dactylellina haptotyla (strain CBS 200.50) TaxID=1284197 RepID=S8A3D5_DACHA|nr:hypothetical protein H072_10909 [Dactylellina haptotyla CBS 200.50]